MNCAVCGKPLSGGLDTFGNPHAPVCWDDYFAELEDPPDKEQNRGGDDPDFVEESIASLKEEIKQLEDDLRQMKNRLDRAEELRDKPLRDAKKKLHKWREAVS